jgi:D-alanyl-lipoteichoic acid acyltransferase DltB (MBOAT superfamily)
MIFTSPLFLIFFVVVFSLYWFVLAPRDKGRVQLSHKLSMELRLALLLLASIVFYGSWDWRFLALVFFSSFLAWSAGLFAGDQTRSKRVRLWAVWAGIIGNVALLCYFKYFNFFIDSAAGFIEALGMQANLPTLRVILPVGISFFVFHALSYVIDVYRGDLPSEKRIDRVTLYIMFFPQLVAGPILRAHTFLPQMALEKKWRPNLAWMGVREFIRGFIYKAVLADNIAPFVDPVYNNLDHYSNLAVTGATVAFGAQIYFDFAGYSIMGIGIGRLFGYHLMRNFNYPYTASNITDFWRRWHISLSSWLRDYLYIPLGGNRGGALATYKNLFVTMLLGGLWHGANFAFVVWGGMQGVGLAAHKLWMTHFQAKAKALTQIPRWVGYAGGLLLTQYFVFLMWGMFRAGSLPDDNIASGIKVIGAMTGLRHGGELGIEPAVWLIPLALVVDGVLGRRPWRHGPAWLRNPWVWGAAMGASAGIILAIYPLKAAPFVYFQF